MIDRQRALAVAVGTLLLGGSAAVGVHAAAGGSDAKSAVAPVAIVKDDGDGARLAALQSSLDELRGKVGAAPSSGPSKLDVTVARSLLDGPTLVVTGTAHIPATPDVLRLNVGVWVKRNSVKEAINAANDAAQRVIGSLKNNGVAAKDLQTQYVNVAENWSASGRDGYNASNIVLAKLRDVGKAGSVMAAAADAGGDDVRLQGLSFDLEENQAQLAEARKGAMEDARRRAEDLARLAGRKLGRVLAVDDNSRPSGSAYQPYAGPSYGVAAGATTADMASSVPVEAGQVNTRFTVTVVFALD